MHSHTQEAHLNKERLGYQQQRIANITHICIFSCTHSQEAQLNKERLDCQQQCIADITHICIFSCTHTQEAQLNKERLDYQQQRIAEVAASNEARQQKLEGINEQRRLMQVWNKVVARVYVYIPVMRVCLCMCVYQDAREQKEVDNGRAGASIHFSFCVRRSYLIRVGQNCIYTLYMTVCMVISLKKIPYTHHIYVYMYGSGQPYT
jgi:hypothetical protein